MAEGGGLGPLQMGIAGHDGGQMGLGLFHQHLFQTDHILNNLGDLLLHVQPEVGGHLVVAGPGGVQPLARLADALDVLVVQGELHPAALNVRQDGRQALHDFLRLVLFNDARIPQHGRVGDGSPDVLLVQPGVKADGGIEIVD